MSILSASENRNVPTILKFESPYSTFLPAFYIFAHIPHSCPNFNFWKTIKYPELFIIYFDIYNKTLYWFIFIHLDWQVYFEWLLQKTTYSDVIISTGGHYITLQYYISWYSFFMQHRLKVKKQLSEEINKYIKNTPEQQLHSKFQRWIGENHRKPFVE